MSTHRNKDNQSPNTAEFIQGIDQSLKKIAKYLKNIQTELQISRTQVTFSQPDSKEQLHNVALSTAPVVEDVAENSVVLPTTEGNTDEVISPSQQKNAPKRQGKKKKQNAQRKNVEGEFIKPSSRPESTKQPDKTSSKPVIKEDTDLKSLQVEDAEKTPTKKSKTGQRTYKLKKPIKRSGLNIFVSEFLASNTDTKKLPFVEKINIANDVWKNLNDEKKEEYKNKAVESNLNEQIKFDEKYPELKKKDDTNENDESSKNEEIENK